MVPLDLALRISAAPPAHSGVALQWSPDAQLVHELLQRRFEYRCVKPVIVVGPPGMMKSTTAEVDPQMSYGGFLRIVFRFHLGIKQPRLSVGSGTQNKFAGVSGVVQLVLRTKNRQIQQLLMQREAVSDLTGQGGFPFQRGGGKNRANTVPYRFVLQRRGPVRISVSPGQVIAVPSIRDSLPLDLFPGIEHRLAK
jgi:hypothetical protein